MKIRNVNKRRNSKRIQSYWRRLKSFRKFSIASIITVNNDNRPYIPFSIDGKLYIALLDSGAYKNVIGGELSRKFQNIAGFRKCYGSVRTTDGQRQNLSGIANVKFMLQDCEYNFEFLVIESIKQDISIAMTNEIGEIGKTDSDDVYIELPKNEKRKLDTVIEMFPSSQREGLGCTHLVQHSIDTGDSNPITPYLRPERRS